MTDPTKIKALGEAAAALEQNRTPETEAAFVRALMNSGLPEKHIEQALAKVGLEKQP